MARLQPDFTPAFSRDVKRLNRRRVGLAPLEEVIELVCRNDAPALDVLRRRHNMHTLKEAGSEATSATSRTPGTGCSSGGRTKRSRCSNEQARTTSCSASCPEPS